MYRLLNHVQHYDELQDTLLMDVDVGLRDLEVIPIAIGTGEEAHDNGDYWTFLPEGDRESGELFQMQSAHGISPSVGLASTVSREGTPEYTPPSSPDSLTRSEQQGQRAAPAPSPCHGGSKSPATPERSVRNLAGQAQQHPGEEHSPKTRTCGSSSTTKHDRGKMARKLGRPRAESITGMIAAYVDHEKVKNIDPQEQRHIVNTMRAYQHAILRARPPSQPSLAVLVMSIGDSSALLLVKEAIQGLRSPQVSDFLCVDRQMPISERIHIIERIGCCTALLKVVRWLHIVTLWENLSQRAGDGADHFVLATPDSVSQHATKKGNPRYLARSEIAKGLSDISGPKDGNSDCNEACQNTRLRRLGQRLGLFVRNWGQGILLILGQTLSDFR